MADGRWAPGASTTIGPRRGPDLTNIMPMTSSHIINNFGAVWSQLDQAKRGTIMCLRPLAQLQLIRVRVAL